MVQRGLTTAAMLAGLGLGCSAYAAQDPDLTAVMDRIKALEAKNKQLEDKLQTASHRQTVDAQIDRAIQRSDAAVGSVITAPDPHCRPLKIGGYLETTYQYNFNQPDNRNNNFRTFDRESNSFDLDYVELNFERLPTQPGEAGFRIDIASGSNANVIASSDSRLNAPDRLFDIEQGYISYIAPLGNGVTLDFGKFVTWTGYEVIEAQDNINASRSFSFGLGIPFTHTGVRATYDVLKGGGCGPCGESGMKWTIGAGIVNGWDNHTDQNDAKTAIFLSNFTPVSWVNWVVTGSVGAEGFTDERARLAGATGGISIIDPFNPELTLDDPTTPGISSLVGRVVDPHEKGIRGMIDTTLVLTPFEKWTFVINAMYAHEGDTSNTNTTFNADGVIGGHPRNRQWMGATGYVKYQFAEKWYVAARADYFNDDGGVRTGADQELYAGTLTLDYAVSEPMHIRFEYRHDEATQNAFQDDRGFSNTDVDDDGAAIFPNNEDRQDTFMMQFLYKF